MVSNDFFIIFKIIMSEQTQRIINLNENMLRFVNMEFEKEAFLDALCALE